MRFSSFVDKKINRDRSELGVVRDVLKKGGVKVEDFTEKDDPHLFVPSTEDGLDFGGVRVYKIGSRMAYRVQNESSAEPYGESYPINIEGLFEDLITDMDTEKAAEQIRKAIVGEMKGFFKKSLEAQNELSSDGFDPHNKIIVVPGKSTDLSNSMS
jgi:hypothetical protein